MSIWTHCVGCIYTEGCKMDNKGEFSQRHFDRTTARHIKQLTNMLPYGSEGPLNISYSRSNIPTVIHFSEGIVTEVCMFGSISIYGDLRGYTVELLVKEMGNFLNSVEEKFQVRQFSIYAQDGINKVVWQGTDFSKRKAKRKKL